jgi:hypothetical protein
MNRPKARYSKFKSKVDTFSFEGFNNTENHKENQLLDMKNISSNKFPFVTNRPSREIVETLTSGKYLFASDKLCWVDGVNFYYDGVSKGVLTADPTSIVEMNDFIIFFPSEQYYDKVGDAFGSFTSGYIINYAAVNDNRMFAVSGNQLLASKQGDFKVWDSFQGISTDSFVADVSTQGDFIGLIVYQDHVTAFKEQYLHELYGNIPSNYSIPEVIKKGCVDQASLVELDGTLFFMSQDGVYKYSGGLPRKISMNINENFVSGPAIGFDNKYYVNLYNGSEYQLFIYNSIYNDWYKEDNIEVSHFAIFENSLYILTTDNKIIKFNSGTEKVEWEIFSHEFDQLLFENKNYRKLLINLELDYGSSAAFYVSKDNKPYDMIKNITEVTHRHFRIPLDLRNCNTFKIKITGRGEFILKNIQRTFDVGGAING